MKKWKHVIKIKCVSKPSMPKKHPITIGVNKLQKSSQLVSCMMSKNNSIPEYEDPKH